MPTYQAPCCGDILTSSYRHDFKNCSCGQNGVAVDGGNDYSKLTGKTLPDGTTIWPIRLYEADGAFWFGWGKFAYAPVPD